MANRARDKARIEHHSRPPWVDQPTAGTPTLTADIHGWQGDPVHRSHPPNANAGTCRTTSAPSIREPRTFRPTAKPLRASAAQASASDAWSESISSSRASQRPIHRDTETIPKGPDSGWTRKHSPHQPGTSRMPLSHSPQVPRLLLAAKIDETACPEDVGLFGAQAVMSDAQRFTHLI